MLFDKKKYIKFFLKKRFLEINKKINLYDRKFDISYIEKYQLELFNSMWEKSFKQIPFYKYWKETNNIKPSLKYIKELDDFPILDNKIIKENYDLIISKSNVKSTISTGGSTGTPTIFPSSISNINDFYSTTYLGRKWWGIEPGDKIVLMWGHSHLLGTGINGKLNNTIRDIKDYILNIKRLNAYNMSIENIKLYYEEIKKIKPTAIIGYTSCIFKLAEYMIENNLSGSLGNQIKCIIPTAEMITTTDINKFKKAFKCNIAIEYGMAETGVVAYSRNNTLTLQIFWDSFYVSLRDTLIVTTLKRDDFPLINYNTGDIVIKNKESDNNYNIGLIQGRNKDIFYVGKKNSESYYSISGIFFVHVIKNFPGVYSIQVQQLNNKSIKISILSKKDLSLDTLKIFFIKESQNDFPNLNYDLIYLDYKKDFISSVSGKDTLRII